MALPRIYRPLRALLILQFLSPVSSRMACFPQQLVLSNVQTRLPQRSPLEVDIVLVLVEGALEGFSMRQHWSFVLKGGVIQLVAKVCS